MNVQIANIHQAEKIYTLIEENEILHAVASRTTEFDNLDSDDLDIEEVECVAQTLYKTFVVKTLDFSQGMKQ